MNCRKHVAHARRTKPRRCPAVVKALKVVMPTCRADQDAGAGNDLEAGLATRPDINT